jgi:hypothetical protein
MNSKKRGSTDPIIDRWEPNQWSRAYELYRLTVGDVPPTREGRAIVKNWWYHPNPLAVSREELTPPNSIEVMEWVHEMVRDELVNRAPRRGSGHTSSPGRCARGTGRR